MRLKFIYWEDSDIGESLKLTHWVNVPVGGLVRGLQLHGTRPETVELDKEELKKLRKNPPYYSDLINSLKDVK